MFAILAALLFLFILAAFILCGWAIVTLIRGGIEDTRKHKKWEQRQEEERLSWLQTQKRNRVSQEDWLEYVKAENDRHTKYGVLSQHLLQLMQQDSTEFNNLASDVERQDYLKNLSGVPLIAFHDARTFNRAYRAALNTYLPHQLKLHTGRGGNISNVANEVPFTDSFARIKSGRKILVSR